MFSASDTLTLDICSTGTCNVQQEMTIFIIKNTWLYKEQGNGLVQTASKYWSNWYRTMYLRAAWLCLWRWGMFSWWNWWLRSRGWWNSRLWLRLRSITCCCTSSIRSLHRWWRASSAIKSSHLSPYTGKKKPSLFWTISCDWLDIKSVVLVHICELQ